MIVRRNGPWGVVVVVVLGCRVVVPRIVDEREVSEVLPRVRSECFRGVLPKTRDLGADIAQHGVAFPASKPHNGCFLDVVRVQDHRKGATNRVCSHLIAFNANLLFS